MDEFIWAQWDSQHQRLYLVYPKYKVKHYFELRDVIYAPPPHPLGSVFVCGGWVAPFCKLYSQVCAAPRDIVFELLWCVNGY